MKIVWIDGTFGSGKTTVASAITKRINNAHLIEFDALQEKYEPNSISDFFGERYPEAKRYLVDALINEMRKLMQEGCCEYLVIPIALINDYCKEKLVNGFEGVEYYHFILTASCEVLHKRIAEQDNRDVDLALTYMSQAMMYLNNNYSDAIRIDTSNMDIEIVVDRILEKIL